MDLKHIQAAFEKKGYAFRYFADAAEAAAYLDSEIDGRTVGFGDSQTLKSMGLYERLCVHNTVYSPMHPVGEQTFYTEAEKTIHTDVFLVSVNGAAETGELVNIDGFGNRVAAMAFGPEKVYVLVGQNKLCAGLEEAMERIKNVACPQNARRLGLNTPCAHTGKCADCQSPQRFCNATLILDRCPGSHPVEILLVQENLGY